MNDWIDMAPPPAQWLPARPDDWIPAGADGPDPEGSQ